VGIGLHNRGLFIALYADDILLGLFAPSIRGLVKLLRICENELDLLDMVINTRKSCCLRIGRRSNVACASVYTTTGVALPWVNDLRYLGVFIIRSRTFKCSLDRARKSFYRSANW